MTFRELTEAERLEFVRQYLGGLAMALDMVVENVTAGDFARAAIDHAQALEWARSAQQSADGWASAPE